MDLRNIHQEHAVQRNQKVKSVYFIRSADNRPYILVTVLAGSTEFQPLMGDADEVVQALSEGFKNKPIKKGELDGALDDDLSIEGPIVVNRETRKTIASFLEEANIPQYQSGTKPPVVTGKTLVFDVSDIRLDAINASDRKNAVEYKALAFIADQTKTTFNYEVKRVRATWDPTLSIPGTNRRGGWRCPVGTRYGGQITDRFGRNCGWGVARRIANAITNIGERMENLDDNRRGRRVNRRNERMMNRLRRDGQGGRVERGLRNIADRLEGEEGGERPANFVERLREDRRLEMERRRRRRGELIDDEVGLGGQPRGDGSLNLPGGGGRGVRTPGEDAPRQRRPRLRESERRRMEREIQEPGAERTPEGGARPQRRRRGQAVPVTEQTNIGDAPRRNESFSAYTNRKYQEYADRIAKIRQEGGDAGLLTRDEWYSINRGNLREAWSRANGGRVPREPRQPQQDRQPRPRAPRNRRVNASDAQAQGSANRRPRPDDQPVPQQRPTARPVQRASSRELENELARNKRRLIEAIPDDATPEQRRLYEEYVNRQTIVRNVGRPDQLPMFLTFDGWKQNYRPANENARIVPDVPAPLESEPDARSDRNVFNQFGENGLPESAYWRAPDYAGDDKAELERRFGRYYDNNNQRNDRGGLVNRRIAEGGGRPARRRQGQARQRRPRQQEQQQPAAPQPPQPPAPRREPPQPPAPRPAAPPRRQTPMDTPTAKQEAVQRMNRRLAPNIAKVKADRLNENMGHEEVDGILIPKAVPVGANNIRTQAKANETLKNGGSLDDVPDKFVRDAIFANAAFPGEPDPTKRFQLEGDPGNGINNRGAGAKKNKTYLITDTVTGKKYIVKSPSFQNHEFIGEQFAAIIGQALGRPMARVRIVGDIRDMTNRERNLRTRNAPLLIEHFDGIIEQDGIINGHRGNADNSPAVIEAKIQMSLLDTIMGNGDRHGGNYLWALHDGKKEVLPIDHGVYRGSLAPWTKDSATTLFRERLTRKPSERQEMLAVMDRLSRISDEQIDAITENLMEVWNASDPTPSDVGRITRNTAVIRGNLIALRDAANTFATEE